MMELALIRTLMDKEFYDNHKGIRCPDKIFTKDVRKIKQTLDYAMDTYDTTLSPRHRLSHPTLQTGESSLQKVSLSWLRYLGSALDHPDRR